MENRSSSSILILAHAQHLQSFTHTHIYILTLRQHQRARNIEKNQNCIKWTEQCACEWKHHIFGYRQRWLFADKNQRSNGFPTFDNGNACASIRFFPFFSFHDSSSSGSSKKKYAKRENPKRQQQNEHASIDFLMVYCPYKRIKYHSTTYWRRHFFCRYHSSAKKNSHC